ncbi:MAG TPA: GAF domain-containing sensor histidine kinase [Burkholderiaceae bacterium]|nr:GAF domain-containing sensor histidine kinase [Burkholderiaceae bacterium]
MRPSKHPRETERLHALHRYGVLDTPRERAFDEVARLAAALCGTSIAVVNLVDATRQWFKSEVGLGVRELPLDDSICAHAILQADYVEIPDTLADERFRDNPLCTSGPGLRFYAGAVLRTEDGLPIGTLCVLDREPRRLADLQRETLQVLARQVMAQLELRRTLAERERLLERLEEADRRKNDFMAMLGHELRNPLAPMRNAMTLLGHEPLGDRGRHALDMSRRQLHQMTRLVDDLLEAARVTRGLIAMRPEPLIVQHVLDPAIEALAATLRERSQRLDLQLPSRPTRLVADPVRLVQIVENLVSNASKYTDPGGTIALRVSEDDRDVVIEVQDDGIGIAAEDLPRLFTPFVQVETAIDRSRGGLGIGLALVRKLAELQGGEVSAHSDGPGRGARFVVRLPRAAAEALPDAA